MDDAERYRQGMRVRRAVLGDAHVDRMIAATSGGHLEWDVVLQGTHETVFFDLGL